MMKRIITLLFVVLMLMTVLPISAFAKGTAYESVASYKELKDYIDDLDGGYEVHIDIKSDIRFEDEIDIDASNIDIYFRGPASFILDGECGFEVNGEKVSLYFEDITFKGLTRIKSEGQAFSIDGDYCLISGARFETCSTYDKNTLVDGLSYNGGAIDVEDGEYCTIENCYFKECAAQGHAGAVYIDEDNCTVSGCTFDNCFATKAGGAIYICAEQNKADIIDCTFIDCGKFNTYGKNVFANGDNGIVIRPTPFSKDEAYFYGCTVYSAEEYEQRTAKAKSFWQSIFQFFGIGSTFSEGNIWIVIAIAVIALGGVAVLIIVKKKKKPVAANGAGTEDEE